MDDKASDWGLTGPTELVDNNVSAKRLGQVYTLPTTKQDLVNMERIGPMGSINRYVPRHTTRVDHRLDHRLSMGKSLSIPIRSTRRDGQTRTLGVLRVIYHIDISGSLMDLKLLVDGVGDKSAQSEGTLDHLESCIRRLTILGTERTPS